MAILDINRFSKIFFCGMFLVHVTSQDILLWNVNEHGEDGKSILDLLLDQGDRCEFFKKENKMPTNSIQIIYRI
jgi:hypothetical protein